ncbi:MAG: hypothetical protein FD131_4796 [Rhodocyclaceae bacterium]|nr:MAG: hypothetical protein FD131_4796 [Rhodocyclaceae bacterium]
MKLKPIVFSASLFAAMVFSLGVQAASDADKAAEAKAPVADMQADKAVKKMKPHSHVEEKTGVPQSMPDAKSDKPNAAKDKSKHFHPRDMK